MNTIAAIPTIVPLPLSQIRLLNGPFYERQKIHAHYLLMVEPDRFLAPFRKKAGLPSKAEPYGGWESRDISGHSLGHYLSALSLLYSSTSDARMLERVDYIVSELAACQQQDGEGYILPVDKRAFEDLRQGKIDASSFSLNGVWVPFYTLHKVLAGLRDAYRFAGSTAALDVERKACNWLDGIMSGLSEAQIQEVLRTEHGGMNEVLADLASDTGDMRYLKMASRDFHHGTVLDPILRGEDNLNGLHGNTQIPKIVGLAREYELTSDPSYRVAAESFWNNVVNCRSFANGGHGESEHFFPPNEFPNKLTPNTCETCNTYNMLKLTSHLFSWEPQAAHMDFVERATINHLLANIGQEPGEFGYFLGLGSVGVKVFSTPFNSWWCCVGTGLENPARYGEQIYYHDTDTLWVNLFMGSALIWPEKGMEIRMETEFPNSDKVRLLLQSEKPTAFTLKLRHPYWCERAELSVNGEAVPVLSTPSSYISVERTWQSGDILELVLPMTLRLDPLPFSNGKIAAVMYGPTLLAGIVPEKEGVASSASGRFSEHLAARGKTDAMPPLFAASSEKEVLQHLLPDTTFAEFMSDGVVKPEDLKFAPLWRVYEEQYAVYFPIMASDDWEEHKMDILAAQEELKRREAATIDSVTPGFQQPEVEHSLRSENSKIADFGGRKCRGAQIATYWGGVWHERSFDILVDGNPLATQHLHVNKPGEFFDEAYHIPNHITHGKTKLTICFKSHPFEENADDIASGLFGLRTSL